MSDDMGDEELAKASLDSMVLHFNFTLGRDVVTAADLTDFMFVRGPAGGADSRDFPIMVAAAMIQHGDQGPLVELRDTAARSATHTFWWDEEADPPFWMGVLESRADG